MPSSQYDVKEEESLWLAHYRTSIVAIANRGKRCLAIKTVWVKIQITLVNFYQYLHPLPWFWKEYKSGFYEVKWRRVTLS